MKRKNMLFITAALLLLMFNSYADVVITPDGYVDNVAAAQKKIERIKQENADYEQERLDLNNQKEALQAQLVKEKEKLFKMGDMIHRLTGRGVAVWNMTLNVKEKNNAQKATEAFSQYRSTLTQLQRKKDIQERNIRELEVKIDEKGNRCSTVSYYIKQNNAVIYELECAIEKNSTREKNIDTQISILSEYIQEAQGYLQ